MKKKTGFGSIKQGDLFPHSTSYGLKGQELNSNSIGSSLSPGNFPNLEGLASLYKKSPNLFGSFPTKPRSFGCGENHFVFACFNSVVKIEPVIFQTWMKILKQVSGSILWLRTHANEKIARENLWKEANKMGIDENRIKFEIFQEKSLYLKNLAGIVDLILDTPIRYGSHSTALDALWAGVPVLTINSEHEEDLMSPGELSSFLPPSSWTTRGVTSMLINLGLDKDLVVSNLDEYEERAVLLGTNKNEWERIKKEVEKRRFTHSLFNSTNLIQNLEKGFEKIWQRYLNGLDPEDIFIESNKNIFFE